MTKKILSVAALILPLLAGASTADTYVVTLDSPVEGVSDALFQSVKVAPLESFEVHGVHYFVMDAPGDVYVETLFSVYGTWPIAMNKVDVDWEEFSAMSAGMKLLSLEPMYCRFCLG